MSTQCTNNPATSTSGSASIPSANPASNTTLTTTPITTADSTDGQPPSITRTIHPPLTPASITVTIIIDTTSPTATTKGTTTDFPLPAFSATAAATTTSDGDSVATRPHCDHAFTLHIGLVGHLRIHRT
ncbi:unnamed protein product [Schistocephalus solidus]|uniref:C2H2-type domain-containing protein n=1 Tax=Schistocephalus solidus TaxID=70667 RepID=A0A183THN3_SCHSO|nr:unnamed protein product [Schistocephalus solidus]